MTNHRGHRDSQRASHAEHYQGFRARTDLLPFAASGFDRSGCLRGTRIISGNLLGDFLNRIQDFRRNILADPEVFALTSINAQAVWKQLKDARKIDGLGHSEAVAGNLRIAGNLRRSVLPDAYGADRRTSHHSIYEDYVIVF